MVTIYNVKKSEIREGLFLVELRGLSTDEKPLVLEEGGKVENGSVFIEIDTGDVYLFDEEGQSWDPVVETEEAISQNENVGD